jgi:hypothetical protein
MKSKPKATQDSLFKTKSKHLPPVIDTTPEPRRQRTGNETETKKDCGCALIEKPHVMLRFGINNDGKRMWKCMVHETYILEEDRKAAA